MEWKHKMNRKSFWIAERTMADYEEFYMKFIEDINKLQEEVEKLQKQDETIVQWLYELFEKLGYEVVEETTETKPAHLRKIKKRK